MVSDGPRSSNILESHTFVLEMSIHGCCVLCFLLTPQVGCHHHIEEVLFLTPQLVGKLINGSGGKSRHDVVL